jgi:hypothetical protein
MRVVSRFYGINSGAPAVVSGVAGLYIFAAPVALGTGSPVPSGQNLSDLVMPFQNLNAPGSGRLNAQAFQVKAVGGRYDQPGATEQSLHRLIHAESRRCRYESKTLYGCRRSNVD